MDDTKAKTYGRALRRLREGREMLAKDLASMVSMSPGHLSELEKGKRTFTASILTRLATALEMETPDLIAKLEETSVRYPTLSETRLRETPASPPYNLPLPPPEPEAPQPQQENDFLVLARFLVARIPKEEAWALVNNFTAAAAAGDKDAFGKARAMLAILGEDAS
jgi:transcriptional regulator with XRE-family HTH domain